MTVYILMKDNGEAWEDYRSWPEAVYLFKELADAAVQAHKNPPAFVPALTEEQFLDDVELSTVYNGNYEWWYDREQDDYDYHFRGNAWILEKEVIEGNPNSYFKG